MSPEPPYRQISNAIRERILSGALAEGDRIPSARALCTEYGVSQVTALKAITTLQVEGLVEPRPGIGTIVTTDGLHRGGKDRFEATAKTGRIYAPGEYARIVSAEIVTAPDDIADVLGLEHGAQVIRRHRVTYGADDRARSISVSYHDAALADVAPDLLKRERIVGGPRYVEECTGRAGVAGTDALSARLATAEEAETLGLDQPAAVLVSRCSLTDADGKHIEYGESVSPPDRQVTYTYGVHRD